MDRKNKAVAAVELLIAGAILAILAFIVVPEFSQAHVRVPDQTLRDHLRALRRAMDRYRQDHKGRGPSEADIVLQLTRRTDVYGGVMPPDADAADYPCGPYLDRIPANPHVSPFAADLIDTDERGQGGGNAGWHYDAESGAIRPDNDACRHY